MTLLFSSDTERSPPKRRSAGVATVLLALVLAACVSSAVSAADSVSAARTAQVHHACADVMGLNPTESPYQSCVMSLQQSLARVDEAAQVDRARHVCTDRGLQPDTRDFAVCVNGESKPSDQK